MVPWAWIQLIPNFSSVPPAVQSFSLFYEMTMFGTLFLQLNNSKLALCHGQRSEHPQVPDVNRDFSRSRSQVIRSYWVHLWCSPSAGCHQSAGRWYKGAAALLLRWLFVSGSRHHQLAVCGFCLGGKSGLSVWAFFFFFFGYFLYILIPPWSVTPAPPLIFGSSGFFVCSSSIIDRISGWLWVFYSQHHLLDTKAPVCLNPF